MKKLLIIFVLVSLLTFSLIFMPRLASQQIKTEDSPDMHFSPGKIVIRFSEEVSPVIPIKVAGIIQTGLGPVDVLCQRFKVHTMRRLFPAPKYPKPNLTRYFVVKLDKSIDLDQVVTDFSNSPFFVEKAEKVAVLKYFQDPDDDRYDDQWHLKQSNDCDIDAPEAWNIETGSDSIILAIADSGVQRDHPDLNDNIWINWDEYNGDEDEDDDENGYIDDIYGWDFDDDDNEPEDTFGHGTHVAGIAAAETNNDDGVAGIAGGWYSGQEGCRIMSLCIGHYDLTMSAAAEAFVYATDMGAKVINCSWKSEHTEYFKDAIDYALLYDVLIVAAAGNGGDIYCNDDEEHYLSMVPGVLVVAATDKDDERAIFGGGQSSNYGPCIDVSAPGKDIWSTYKYSGYASMSGTSMAAPMVTGLAGLLRSRYPNWNRGEVKDAIVDSADPIDVPENMGSGRINAYKALRQDTSPAAPSNLDDSSTSWYHIHLTWQDNSDNENGFKIERDSSIIATVKSEVTYYDDHSVTGGITYAYRVIAYNLEGDSPSDTKNVEIPESPIYAPDPEEAEYDSGEVYFTWFDDSDNEQGFIIERNNEWDPYWEERGSVGPNETEFYDGDLEPDTIYHYRVRAYNPYGYSPYSAPPAEVYVPWELR